MDRDSREDLHPQHTRPALQAQQGQQPLQLLLALLSISTYFAGLRCSVSNSARKVLLNLRINFLRLARIGGKMSVVAGDDTGLIKGARRGL